MFALGSISFNEKTFEIDRCDVDVKKLKMPFFFSITLIYISQPSFIKKKKTTKTQIVDKGHHAHSGAFHKPADLARVPRMSRFCARRAHFEPLEAVLFLWADLLCACWQSVRNICFGRCCDHMTPSIHKVPACPFTGLHTVSHCTDDHISCICCTMRHINARFFPGPFLFYFTSLLRSVSVMSPPLPPTNPGVPVTNKFSQRKYMPLHQLTLSWLKKHTFMALIRTLCSTKCASFVTFYLCMSGK